MFIQRINEREPFVIVRSYRTRLLPADQMLLRRKLRLTTKSNSGPSPYIYIQKPNCSSLGFNTTFQTFKNSFEFIISESNKRTTVGIFRHIECKKKKFVILVRLDVPSRLIPLGFNFHLCYYYILQRKKRRRFLQNGQLGTNFGKMRPLLLNRGVILSWPCRCVF